MHSATDLQTVYIHSSCYCEEHEPADEPYGNWHESYVFTVDGASLSNQTDDAFPVKAVKPGDDTYVLYLYYSQGDSFGNAEGLGSVIWAFADHSAAQQALAACQLAIDQENPSFVFKSDAGKEITLGNPTTDYFCHGSVFLTKVRVFK
jgi:hypothetical protein